MEEDENDEEDAKPAAIPGSIQVEGNPTMRSVVDGCFDDGDSAEDESDHPSQPSDDSRMFAK